MTQGYGPQGGQQGQWGPQGQEPQQPAQQPQWGQPSPPPPAPGGYPGAAGTQAFTGSGAPAGTGAAGGSTVAKLVTWMFYAVLAVVAVRLISNVVVFAIQFAGGATGSSTTVGIGGAFGILGLLANGLVTLALIVLAVMVAIQASGRGRTGAIIVLATVVLAVIAYWILRGILYAVMINADYTTIGLVSLVYLVAEVIRALIVFAALIVGALMSRRWAKENA